MRRLINKGHACLFPYRPLPTLDTASMNKRPAEFPAELYKNPDLHHVIRPLVEMIYSRDSTVYYLFDPNDASLLCGTV
jgi:hypothetical protein